MTNDRPYLVESIEMYYSWLEVINGKKKKNTTNYFQSDEVAYEKDKKKNGEKITIFKDLPPKICHERARDFFRLVIEDYFGLGDEWKKCGTILCPENIKKYQLTVFFKRLQFPPELKRPTDKCNFLAYILYPERFKNEFPTEEDFIKNLWDMEFIRSENSNIQISKFKVTLSDDDSENRRKLIYLGNIFLAENPIRIENQDQMDNFDVLKEKYLFFTDGKKGDSFFAKAGLKTEALEYFGTSLDFFHECLSPNDKSEFLYNYAKFIMQCNINVKKNK